MSDRHRLPIPRAPFLGQHTPPGAVSAYSLPLVIKTVLMRTLRIQRHILWVHLPFCQYIAVPPLQQHLDNKDTLVGDKRRNHKQVRLYTSMLLCAPPAPFTSRLIIKCLLRIFRWQDLAIWWKRVQLWGHWVHQSPSKVLRLDILRKHLMTGLAVTFSVWVSCDWLRCACLLKGLGGRPLAHSPV